MNAVTQKYIKDYTGLSKQAISKACSAGHLTMCKKAGKKMVDLDGHLTVRWLAAHPPKQKQDNSKPEKQRPPIIPDFIDEEPLNKGNNPSGLSGDDPVAKNLKDQKLQEQIEQIRIKNQQIRSFLIPKELVRKLFGRIYAIDENQFKTINVNVTPKISAIYNTANAKKSNEIIEIVKEMGVEISEADEKELRSDINKTLESGEPDRILEMNKVLEDATGMILKNIQREIDEFLKLVEELGG